MTERTIELKFNIHDKVRLEPFNPENKRVVEIEDIHINKHGIKYTADGGRTYVKETSCLESEVEQVQVAYHLAQLNKLVDLTKKEKHNG